MRNKVLSIIFLLIVILLVVAIFNGIKIGSFEILSISQLKNKDDQLAEKINEASNLTSIEYPENIETLEQTYEKYNVQKQKYEEISGFADGGKNQVYETKQYDIGYLWKIVGNYATSYNLTIAMDVRKTTGQDLYDLYFNIAGQYVNICEFITQIENNSDLYFRIYNFKMSGSSETVSSSFTVKNISIDPTTIKETTTLTSVEEDS